MIRPEIFYVLLGLILLIYLSYCIPSYGELEIREGYCTGVIDGDTLLIKIYGAYETLRLIGIDAPEKEGPYTKEEYYGIEAKRFTEHLVKGKILRLEFDIEKRDKYGRLLAYVYLPDGLFLNKYLIEQGMVRVYKYFNYRYKPIFIEIERTAKKNCIGLWMKWCMRKMSNW